MTQPEVDRLEVGSTLCHPQYGEGQYTYYCYEITRMCCYRAGTICLDFGGNNHEVPIESVTLKGEE